MNTWQSVAQTEAKGDGAMLQPTKGWDDEWENPPIPVEKPKPQFWVFVGGVILLTLLGLCVILGRLHKEYSELER